MSFREKSDLLSFISVCLMGDYFVALAHGILMGGHAGGSVNYFYLFWALVFVLVVIQVVTHMVLAARSPKDANTPLDERERLIHLRATRPAYFVLLTGAFLTIGTLHLGFSTWQIAHCILFVLWVSEMLRYGTRLYFYRREA